MEEIINAVKWIWDSIKIPVILFSLFLVAGFGLAVGVASSDGYIGLLSGKALVITLIDMPQ